MSDQIRPVTREDLEQHAQEIVDAMTETGESMKSPVFLRGLGFAAALGVIYLLGKRRGGRRIRKAILDLTREV